MRRMVHLAAAGRCVGKKTRGLSEETTTTIPEQRLAKMGIDIAHVDRRGKGVLPFRRYKDLVFFSGHGPFDLDDNPLR